MRPPVQSAALQQNENLRHPSAHNHQQQQQQQQQIGENRSPTTKPVVSYFVTPQQQVQQSSVSDSPATVTDPVKVATTLRIPPTTRTFSYCNSENNRRRSCNDRRGDTIIDISEVEDETIQLVDLSTSPPQEAISLQPPHRIESLQLIKRSSVGNSDFFFSRSSSSEEEEGSYSSSGGRSSLSRGGDICVRSSTFDDEIAENFIINYPAEDTSPAHRNQNECGINLPLSETEPLLTNIDVPDKQRSICLSKNSSSLIFTKKNATPSSRFFASFTGAPSRGVPNNNRPEQKRLHHSFRSPNEPASGCTSGQRRKSHTKHLPATYHQQQRRSLQLNYNNNLVTTSTCSTNNNYCCNIGCADDQSGITSLHKPLHHHQRQAVIGLSAETTPARSKQTVAVVTGVPTVASTTTTAAVTRKQHAYSWYAPIYTALEEELEQDSRDSSPIHNLANTKKHHSATAAGAIQYTQHQRFSRNSSLASATEAGGDNETVALLETRNQINIQAQLHAQAQTQVHHQAVGNATRESVDGVTEGGIGGVPHPKRKSNSTHSGLVLPTSLSLPSSENIVPYDVDGTHAGSLGLTGGPIPRRRRFENFLKSLVGLKSSASNAMTAGSGRNNSHGSVNGGDAPSMAITAAAAQPRRQLPTSPEITITRTPSEQNMVVMREPAGRYQQKVQQQQTKSQRHRRSSDRLQISTQGSTSSLNVVQQKLWNILRREGSASSLHQEKSNSVVQYTGLRKCETVLALTRQTNSMYSPVLDTESCDGTDVQVAGGDRRFTTLNNALLHSTRSGIFNADGVEQIRPLNRLRNSMTSMNATCSRCSSILSLAATGSRYSLNISGNTNAGTFINTVPGGPGGPTLNSSHGNLRATNHALSESASSRQIGKQCRQQPQNPAELNSDICLRKSSINPSSSITPNHGISTSSSSSTVNILSPTTPTTPVTFTSQSKLPPLSAPRTLAPAPATVTNTTTSPTAIVTTSATTSSASTSSMTSSCAASLPIAPLQARDPTYPLTVTSMPQNVQPKVPDATDANAAQPVIGTSSSTPISSEPGSTPNYDASQYWLSMYQMGTPSGAVQLASPSTVAGQPTRPFEMFTCKLCLIAVETAEEATTLHQCNCQFCTECMRAYVEFEISEGAHEISCPDAQCPSQGIMTLPEIANLTTANLMKKHHRYRLNREIELDKTRTWCPRAGCETVCNVGGGGDASLHSDAAPSTSTTAKSVVIASPNGDGLGQFICAVHCPSCREEFCSACKKSWHPNISCEENSRRLVADGQDDIGIPFDNELIKCCPMCAVPIEKDEGCAQMMCKRCKHVFCWYCLASLDDDFLLRHYDKGPCKNKLGHSRASVVWHRAQVIGIFAGFGILLLVASPLLLLAAPCIICCKCRSCSGSKIDEGDGELDEAAALQS